MGITYEQMIAKKKTFDDEFIKRIEFLYHGIKKLLVEYRASIGISESNVWKNNKGEARQYVMPMTYDDGDYKFKGINTIDSNPCDFFIATVLDVKHGKPIFSGCNVRLKTDQQAEELYVLVGDYPQQKEFKIVNDDFSYVCIEIQNKTFLDIDRFKKS